MPRASPRGRRNLEGSGATQLLIGNQRPAENLLQEARLDWLKFNEPAKDVEDVDKLSVVLGQPVVRLNEGQPLSVSF